MEIPENLHTQLKELNAAIKVAEEELETATIAKQRADVIEKRAVIDLSALRLKWERLAREIAQAIA